MIDILAGYTIPFLILFIPIYGIIKRVDVLEAFIAGAEEALTLAVRIIPYIVAIFVAIGIFRASGALELFTSVTRPVLDLIGIPGEVVPLAIVRPLSGNGSLAIMSELLVKWGPDSFIGRLASAMQGSTDTTFYVLSLYFGSVGVLKTRHALQAGLAADLAGLIAATMLVKVVFGY